MTTATVDVSRVLDALGDPTRRAVVTLLSDGPRRAGELAVEAGTSAPSMSRHLRALLAAGVVTDERSPDDARARVFSLRHDSIEAMQAWLDHLKEHWDGQLASFRHHVEKGSH